MKFLLSFLVMAGLLTSCEKSLENFREDSPVATDTIWATANAASLEINQLQTQLTRPGTTDSFSISAGANLQTSNGLRVEIPANAFTGGMTGTAQSEINFLRTQGDLIRMTKSTLSNGVVLQTAGTFYIGISKGGQALALQSGKNFHFIVNDSMPVSSYKAYTGETPATNGFGVYNWRQNDSLTISSGSGSYRLSSNRQLWQCIAKGLDTVSQKSRVVLSMPSVYTNANTETFIVFKNASSVVQLAPDATNRIWLAEKIPAGKNVVYITLTKKGTDYWLGAQEMITAFNQNIHITPQKKSLQSISDFLDNL